MKKQNFSFSEWFSEWLAGKEAVSFTLAIGVVFLIGCYTKIIHITNPDAENFAYWQWLIILLSHVDAFFFGLCTIVLMYQASKPWHKILFCSFEGSMIFLYINQNFLTEMGYNPELVLGIYLGVFGGSAMYFLGSLSKAHREEASPLPYSSEVLEEERTLKEAQEILSTDLSADNNTKNTVISGLKRYDQREKNPRTKKQKIDKPKKPKGYAKLVKLFEEGYSINKAAEKVGVRWETAKKARILYENENN